MRKLILAALAAPAFFLVGCGKEVQVGEDECVCKCEVCVAEGKSNVVCPLPEKIEVPK